MKARNNWNRDATIVRIVFYEFLHVVQHRLIRLNKGTLIVQYSVIIILDYVTPERNGGMNHRAATRNNIIWGN